MPMLILGYNILASQFSFKIVDIAPIYVTLLVLKYMKILLVIN